MIGKRLLSVGFLWCGLALGLSMICAQVFAHHGTSAYEEHPITLKGTVTEFAWSNPHSQIYFDVVDDKGNAVHWSCETLSPSRLVRAGWTRTSLKPADKITIILLPAKNGTPVGYLEEVVLADGSKLTRTEK
jgi:hypothetical protein